MSVQELFFFLFKKQTVIPNVMKTMDMCYTHFTDFSHSVIIDCVSFSIKQSQSHRDWWHMQSPASFWVWAVPLQKQTLPQKKAALFYLILWGQCGTHTITVTRGLILASNSPAWCQRSIMFTAVKFFMYGWKFWVFIYLFYL